MHIYPPLSRRVFKVGGYVVGITSGSLNELPVTGSQTYDQDVY